MSTSTHALRGALTAVAMILGWMANPAWACTSGPFSAWGMDTKPSLPANVHEPGQAISRWMDAHGSAQLRVLDKCVSTWKVPQGITVSLSGAVGTYSEGGTTYSIYPTGVEGVGIIYKFRLGGKLYDTTPWVAVTETPNALDTSMLRPEMSNSTWWAGNVYAKYIRVAGDVPLGTVNIPSGTMFMLRGTLADIPFNVPVRKGAHSLYFRSVPRCRFTTSVVALGNTQLDSFRGVGPSSHAKDFNVAINCEGAAGALKYAVLALGAAVDEDQGLLAVDSLGGDEAQGVALQLLDSAGAPRRVNGITEYPFANVTRAGTWQRAFRARYYQLGSEAPKPGYGNASVRLILIYP